MAKHKAKISAKAYDELSPDAQAFYTKKGDGYVATLEPVDGVGVQDVAELKETISDLREEVGDLEKEVKPWRKLDTTPEKAKAALSRKPTEQTEDVKKAVADAEAAVRAELEEKFEKERADFTKTEEGLVGELRGALITAEASRVITKLGIKDRFAPIIRKEVELAADVVVGSDGKRKAIIKDPKKPGRARISGKPDDNGDMGVEEFVSTDLRNDEDFSAFFPGDGAQGTGVTDGQGSGAGRSGPTDNGVDTKKSGAGEEQVQDPVQELKDVRRKQAAAAEAGTGAK